MLNPFNITETGRLVLALISLRGVGNKTVNGKYLHLIPKMSRYIDDSTPDDILAGVLREIRNPATPQDTDAAIRRYREILNVCHEQVRVLSILDETYPPLLRDLSDAPPILYLRGSEVHTKKCVTVVGTRDPSDLGREISSRIGRYYDRKGLAICNGLAQGIDFSAIQGGGTVSENTVGVLGIGLNLARGSKHYLEAARLVIEAGGSVLSEEPPDSEGSQYTAISACRIQAGLSKATILVQSSQSGGTRFTIREAVKLKRLVGVVHPVTTEYGLEANGANRTIIENGISGLGDFIGESAESSSYRIIRDKSDYRWIDAALDSGDSSPPLPAEQGVLPL